MFLRVTPDCRPYKQISSGIIDLKNVFRRMGRQGDTIDRLGKMLDEEVIAETYCKDDGTYRAIAFFGRSVLTSVFANYPEVSLASEDEPLG